MAAADDGELGAGLLWGLRRYAALIAALLVAAVTAGVLIASSARRNVSYTATALVIAATLEVNADQLPRFGESVFNGGSVARAVASAVPGTDFRALVPDRISVEPVRDTIAFRVQGHSRDPQQAAELANRAAAAFVTQLNRAGEGVGTFKLQDAAFVPREPAGLDIAPALAGLLGLVAAGVLSLGLLALLVGVRRPVLSGAAAARTVGAPLLGSVTLPKRGTGRPRGLRPVLARLAVAPTPFVELATAGRPSRDLLPLLEALRQRSMATGSAGPLDGDHIRRIVVADEDEQLVAGVTLRSSQPTSIDPSPFSVVVVVPHGVPTVRVSRVLELFDPDEVIGTVLVRRGRRLRRDPVPVETAAPASVEDPTPVDDEARDRDLAARPA